MKVTARKIIEVNIEPTCSICKGKRDFLNTKEIYAIVERYSGNKEYFCLGCYKGLKSHIQNSKLYWNSLRRKHES